MTPSLVIVGTVALDDVKTPFGEVHNALGGSAFFAGISASYWTSVGVMAIVGSDYPSKGFETMKSRGMDVAGIEISKEPSFHWSGEYGFDLSSAKTLQTDLNCLLSFKPDISKIYPAVHTLFLANIDPEIQKKVILDLSVRPSIIALDTMNFWIENKREKLLDVLKLVDILTINEGEARMLSGESNLISAARIISAMGPQTLIIKRGEYGAMVFNRGKIFLSPAFPLESLKDPTGAGDSFAGGFLGYMASEGGKDDATLRRGIVVGSVMASFCVSEFSSGGMENLSPQTLAERLSEFSEQTDYRPVSPIMGMLGG
ncbi:PfkB family carbohydrate kinase [Leptospirillum ferrooxidans]|jgi:sugar/nucleoside kinase (ribokinase family)|uniref:Putative carbohydrate kinase, PfkB family n=2 Tax=root TaxID=1 RepID=I0INV0_LEPFC|nr:PfkB family carbohydrate kinase [Leptospirillum ferrooxidans]BAM06949.1 putative carbohydrate kinase, PfkB family [Leptospirillum ferrooxidans C2-3]